MKAVLKFTGAYLIMITYLLSSCEKEPMEGTVADVDGNVYKTVKIGDQWWMAENLKTTKYNDGINLPNVTGNSTWSSLLTPGFCWYNNDEDTFKNTYGALYNWYAVSTGRLCPIGWHVPSHSEWNTLETFLGGLTVAGAKLQETGTTHWQSPNDNATNETLFTALPGGYRNHDGNFYGIYSSTGWFSATEKNHNDAWVRSMYSNSGYTADGYWKKAGYGIRCVKD